MTAPMERGAESEERKESCKIQKNDFFPFLVVWSDFGFLVIPSGSYWVPAIHFFNLM